MPSAASDAELVQESLGGNRDAFNRIVTRYQSLICSLAYSATGDLGRSEDLAQETFVAAWKQLGSLREPEKLKSWLCGIVRNLTSGARRRDGREPSHRAEELEAAGEPAATEPLPADQAVSREEAALLWSSLERVPELYREPLILFYREHQSIERVAAELDLSEDAVKQRLARGRKLLQEQMLAVIEGALGRSAPTAVFTAGVMGALPLASAGAGLGALGGVGVTAKGAGWLAVLGTLLAPVSGFLAGFLGYKIEMERARSQAERDFIRSFSIRLWIGIAFVILVPIALSVAPLPLRARTPGVGLLLMGGVALAFIGLAGWLLLWCRRNYGRVIRTTPGAAAPHEPAPVAFEYRSAAAFLGLPLVHVRFCRRGAGRRRPVRAWIALGDIALGGLVAFGGVAVAPFALGMLGVGLVSWGCVGVGLCAIGGLAFGAGACGGIAVGWDAAGAISLAWHAALGGWALAHDYAQGRTLSYAVLPRGADAWAIRREIEGFGLFIQRSMRWMSLVWVASVAFNWHILRRTRRQKRALAR
ncbi:MAG TPA: RNA polymerase sigma factor [Opitutaceae bacterium]|nr:RNA polymerase sigma factor [Opitutaceae bacterium]